jgi:hypothetical protein
LERLCLAEKRGEEHRLRHPDRVGILGRDSLERERTGLAPIQPDLARLESRVRLLEHVLEKPELVEQVRRARLQHLSAELAVERLVPFQHEDLGAALGQ